MAEAERRRAPRARTETDVKETWIPKTSLGRRVMNGEIANINEVFDSGEVIREAEIVDYLIPDIRDELIYIGGMPGKGGGKQRTPLRVTTRMHKSGRKRTIHALVAVGNSNGILGIGYASGEDARTAIEKATKKAKLGIIPIRRGCGSWECGCGGSHSIPFKTCGKEGSVEVTLMPAPKGIKLCVATEVKKIMNLAGVGDMWMKSRRETGTRLNFIRAIFNAFENLNKIKVSEEIVKTTGMNEGIITSHEKPVEAEEKSPAKKADEATVDESESD